MNICSFASLPGHIQVDFQRALLDFDVLRCTYQNVLKLAHLIKDCVTMSHGLNLLCDISWFGTNLYITKGGLSLLLYSLLTGQ